MEIFGIGNIANGKVLVSSRFAKTLYFIVEYLNEYPYPDCPELPEKLNIDGREVSFSVALHNVNYGVYG
jgi:hypothetical protein